MFEEFDARTETRIVRDASGVARVLSHQDRFVATRAATPRLAAKDYLDRYGRLLGLRPQHLKNLLLPVEHTPTDAAVEYRLVAEKHQFDLTTVAFHQTYLGLPVWEAGLSVTMKHKPLRVIGARSTLHPTPKITGSSAKHLTTLQKLDAESLGRHLGLARHVSDATPLRINNQ